MRFLETQELRIAAIIDDKDSFPEHSAFESTISTFVNNLYFSSEYSPASAWLLEFVDNNCPKRMSLVHCTSIALEARGNCDVSSKSCCPDEGLCNSGVKVACPYDNCRKEILSQLFEYLVPLRIGTFFVCVLSSLMLVLSCLLISFNKRDEIEIELLKGGNISEDDIAAIRRLKSNKARDNTIDFDQLEEAPRSRFGSRKRHVKVAPNQAELA